MADDNNIEDDIQVEELQPDEQLVIPEVLPLLPVRDVIIFPFMIIPLFVGREKSINAVDMALSKDRLVFLSTQKDISKEDPTPDDLYQYGTVGMIMRMLKLSDGRVKILVQGLARAKINSSKEKNMTYTVEITKIKETHMDKAPVEVEATIRNVRDILEKLASLGKIAFPEVMMVLDNMQDPGRVADLAAANLGLGVAEAQEVLETIDPIKRLNKVYDLLLKEHQVSQMQAKIQTQAREEMDRTQREYYLREQLKAIKNELGDFDEGNDDASEFRDKINKAKMPKEVEKEAIKQADRLEAMHPDAAEATLIRTYLEWLVDLPWTKTTKESLNIKKAKSILDSDHYGLDKVKERILEYLA
ncbi:MAG: LON peptidase substrate-binding domain-containing protein, partial [Deltaproteobacteria bacterium]|nr:LON peptidase substrate-binding domain-containing protein [Deltaproteobacteria bacterium]